MKAISLSACLGLELVSRNYDDTIIFVKFHGETFTKTTVVHHDSAEFVDDLSILLYVLDFCIVVSLHSLYQICINVMR